jgi:hypothetical protein
MPPSDPRAELAREWLDRAERDLRLARMAIGDPPWLASQLSTVSR